MARLLRLATDKDGRRRIATALRAREDELRLARQIQLGLLPRRAPTLPGFDLAAVSVPAGITGSDYFDYFLTPDGGQGIVVGDACGHGVGPALLTASTRAYLRALARTSADVGALLTQTNRQLSDDIRQDHFVTVLLCRLDPRTRSLAYASAGHLPGYVLDRSGRVRTRLESTGFPLGVDAEARLAAGPVQLLRPGDLVFLYTDGIEEAGSPDDKAFRIHRALDYLRGHRHRSAAEMVEGLCRSVREFTYPHKPHDDVTAIVLKVLPTP